jgi:hypothetical protein
MRPPAGGPKRAGPGAVDPAPLRRQAIGGSSPASFVDRRSQVWHGRGGVRARIATVEARSHRGVNRLPCGSWVVAGRRSDLVCRRRSDPRPEAGTKCSVTGITTVAGGRGIRCRMAAAASDGRVQGCHADQPRRRGLATARRVSDLCDGPRTEVAGPECEGPTRTRRSSMGGTTSFQCKGSSPCGTTRTPRAQPSRTTCSARVADTGYTSTSPAARTAPAHPVTCPGPPTSQRLSALRDPAGPSMRGGKGSDASRPRGATYDSHILGGSTSRFRLRAGMAGVWVVELHRLDLLDQRLIVRVVHVSLLG